MTMNRIIPIIGVIVLAIAIAVVLKSRQRAPQPDMMTSLPQAPAPDADTPADTVRSLSAKVADLAEHTKRLTEENQRLREANKAAQVQEERVVSRVRNELANEYNRAAQQDNTALSSVTAQLEQLRSRVSKLVATSPKTPAAEDMPVGFGYGGGADAGIHWIEDLGQPDALSGKTTAATLDALGVLDSLGATGDSLLHGNRGAGAGGSASTATGKIPALRTRLTKRRTGASAGVKPVYTIPANATLMNSTAFSALVGRVPVGGQVQDPMPIKVLIGADNLAANGHHIPGLEGIVMSGHAIGDWTLSCVRGTLTTATFVFEDGRVQTFGERKAGQKGGGKNNRNQIGWISDRFGVPCVSGKRITNAPGFLSQRIGLMALTAAAEAAAAETTTVVGSTGTVSSGVTGDQGKYILGKTISGATEEIDTWLTERQAQSFDAIYVGAGTPITVHLDITLPIDYDPDGRMLDHHARLTDAGGPHGYLD